MNLQEALNAWKLSERYIAHDPSTVEGVIEAAARTTLQARQLVTTQAEDDGLWFEAETAPEAYLQQELRRLHAVVESVEP